MLMYMPLYGQCMISFILGKYLGEEWLHHVVGIYLTCKETAKLFSKEILTFYIPPSMYEYMTVPVLSLLP